MEQSKHRTFRRADGVLGVGYVMTFAGVLQASIAWPDRQAERHIFDDLGRDGIEEITSPAQLHRTADKPAPNADTVAEPEASTVPESDPAQDQQARRERRESEAQALRDYLTANGTEMQAKEVVAAMKDLGIEVTPQQVSHAKAAVKAAAESSEAQPAAEQAQPVTEEQAIRNYLADHGSGATNKAVVDALKTKGINVTSAQVTREKNAIKAGK